MFPTVRDFDGDNARKTDWFINFHDLDEAVKAEREAKLRGS